MIFPFSLLFGCGGPVKKIEPAPAAVIPAAGEYVEGAELLCLAQTEEEAKKIAELYGIELVEFSYGVATFHTTENPGDVIKRGLEKGYPELSINGYSELY
ncbi:hypothetical protein [Butyrivibrio sp. MC2021]|uniref:hypothetical protein n=1 Tax=Butyrivibrio sp. MC2021 TaxID=1408306 RepID=UPI00047CA022|nr:hypothetical protein [Butyrivibrio sp. MC2021]